MFADPKPEVLVVGAGPVGLFASLSLARSGVRTAVVDTGVWPCKHSYALALHSRSISLLEACGIAQKVTQNARFVRTLGLSDASGTQTSVSLEALPGAPSPLAVTRQDLLEQALESELTAAGVEVKWLHEASAITQTPESAQTLVGKLEKESRGYIVAHTEWVVGKTAEVKTGFVVGADGYNSRVRRSLNVDFPEVGEADYYAVFECQCAEDPGGELGLVFGEKTTDVLWPLAGRAVRWSFQLTDYSDEEAETLKDKLLEAGFGYFPTERVKDRVSGGGDRAESVLDDAHFRKLLAERAPWFKNPIESITWRTVVRFERRRAASYGNGRVWLAGDSAHLTGPAGIQSMNAGLAEAADLAAALSIRSAEERAKALDAYNRSWQQEWKRLQATGAGVAAVDGAHPFVKKYAARLLGSIPATGDQLAEVATRLGLKLGV